MPNKINITGETYLFSPIFFKSLFFVSIILKKINIKWKAVNNKGTYNPSCPEMDKDRQAQAPSRPIANPINNALFKVFSVSVLFLNLGKKSQIATKIKIIPPTNSDLEKISASRTPSLFAIKHRISTTKDIPNIILNFLLLFIDKDRPHTKESMLTVIAVISRYNKFIGTLYCMKIIKKIVLH